MAYGIVVENGSGELVMSSDAIIYSYIGRATHTGTVQPPASAPDGLAGYSTYTINWAADIEVVLPMTVGGRTRLLSATQAGSTWTIKVHHGANSTNARGFADQAVTTVYVFGAPIPPATGWGLALYNAAGVLSADLTRRPLGFKSRLSFGSTEDSKPLPGGISTPGFLGAPNDRIVTSTANGAFWDWRYFHTGVTLNAGNVLRENYLAERDDGEDSPTSFSLKQAFTMYLIELAGLA